LSETTTLSIANRNTLAMFAVVPAEHASHTPKIVLRERKSPWPSKHAIERGAQCRQRVRQASRATLACANSPRRARPRSAAKKLISCCDVRREMDSIVTADGA
jgi:hypothetical protein